ncbi:hypothetical protein [Parashewanella tropica]|uniref:hypothetical protein n=1 Tax=Parashewanella tropica TaxID=2547970 RepID=UPI001059D8A0|nr:hypothetical protein [Parashewanella tropica]
MIKNLDENQFVIVPINKGEPDVIKKISTLLGSLLTKNVDLVYFSFAKEQPEILSDYFDSFPFKRKVQVITPFRPFAQDCAFAPSVEGVWKYKHFLLAQEQLPECVAGNIDFQFHPESEQFKLDLAEKAQGQVYDRAFYIFPTVKASDCVASFQLLANALGFFKQFSNCVRCPISGKKCHELVEPCMDSEGNVYEKKQLIRHIQHCGKNPVTKEPMTEQDIIVASRFNELIRESADIERQCPLNYEDVMRWLDNQAEKGTQMIKPLLRLLKENQSQQDKLQQEFEQLTMKQRQVMSVAIPPAAAEPVPDGASIPHDDIEQQKQQAHFTMVVTPPVSDVEDSSGSDSEDNIALQKLRAQQEDRQSLNSSSGVDSD